MTPKKNGSNLLSFFVGNYASSVNNSIASEADIPCSSSTNNSTQLSLIR